MYDQTEKASVCEAVIGIGTDLVEVKRIEALITKYPKKSLSRLFTKTERQYCDAQGDSFQHYAARIAAKEAVFKALGTGLGLGISWRQVQVTNLATGEPRISLKGAALCRFKEIGGVSIRISLSHTESLAIAFVVLVGDRDKRVQSAKVSESPPSHGLG